MKARLIIIYMILSCCFAKAQTLGGDSSPPLPPEISAELFDKAIELLKEVESWYDHSKCPDIGYGHKLLLHENLTAGITEDWRIRCSGQICLNVRNTFASMGKMLCF